MENLIIILSMLLNIALIIAVAIYMKRFNKVSEDYKKCINDYESVAKEYRDISLELSDLRNLITEINKQLVESSKSRSELIKIRSELIKKCDRQNAEIESLQTINNNLLNDNRKLSDEITILKEQVESLNNHLQEQLGKHEGAKAEKKRNKKETEKESARHC